LSWLGEGLRRSEIQRAKSRPRLIQALIDAFRLSDLRGRILFTLGILIAFRFVAHITAPGIDPKALEEFFNQPGTGALWEMLNLFSGGGMKEFSIVALGVYPYITSSIIMQLLVPVIPRLQALSREGEPGRQKINLYTHWLTVPLAALGAFGQLKIMQSYGVIALTMDPLNTATIILCLTAGTMFLVWLGELITERGIGNGISIIIFAGILASLPGMVRGGIIEQSAGHIGGVVVFGLFALAIFVFIVIFTEAARRIPVHYSRSVFQGRRMYRQSGSTFVPLRVNTAGMIPLIFAMSIMFLPGVIATWIGGGAEDFILKWFGTGSWLYWLIYGLLVIGFAFFYTMVIFEQMNLADTLQKQGGFVPGIRPGRHTAEYLDGVIHRITWAGAFFLAIVAVMPFAVQQAAPGITMLQISSAGILIVVGVALDTMKQIEAQLTMRRYEGFLK
jgi:preprotein translocase subunit SecY